MQFIQKNRRFGSLARILAALNVELSLPRLCTLEALKIHNFKDFSHSMRKIFRTRSGARRGAFLYFLSIFILFYSKNEVKTGFSSLFRFSSLSLCLLCISHKGGHPPKCIYSVNIHLKMHKIPL